MLLNDQVLLVILPGLLRDHRARLPLDRLGLLVQWDRHRQEDIR